MQTSPYDSFDVQRYVMENHFPYQSVWNYYLPPPSMLGGEGGGGNSSDELLDWCQPALYPTAAAGQQILTRFCFGKFQNDYHCPTPDIFKRYVAESGTGRVDAGAVYSSKGNGLPLYKHFVIDLDATDFKEVRTTCGCGEEKARMCELCTYVVRAAAMAIVSFIKLVYGWKRIHCFFSGGRGLHIRILDLEACSLTDSGRKDVINTIKLLNNTRSDDERIIKSREELAKLESPEQLDMHIPIAIDERASYESGHLTRCPFTVHEATGRICFPLESPADFTTVKVAPTIKEVLGYSSVNYPPEWEKALSLLESWCTVN